MNLKLSDEEQCQLVRCIVNSYAKVLTFHGTKHYAVFNDDLKIARLYKKGFFANEEISKKDYDFVINEFQNLEQDHLR